MKKNSVALFNESLENIIYNKSEHDDYEIWHKKNTFKTIFIPANNDVLASTFPLDYKNQKEAPTQIGKYEQEDYELWVIFHLEAMKRKDYRVIFYNNELSQRGQELLDYLESKDLILEKNAKITNGNDLTDLVNIWFVDLRNSVFIACDEELVIELELTYAPLGNSINEIKPDAGLHYQFWGSNIYPMKIGVPSYGYNAKDRLAYLFPNQFDYLIPSQQITQFGINKAFYLSDGFYPEIDDYIKKNEPLISNELALKQIQFITYEVVNKNPSIILDAYFNIFDSKHPAYLTHEIKNLFTNWFIKLDQKNYFTWLKIFLEIPATELPCILRFYNTYGNDFKDYFVDTKLLKDGKANLSIIDEFIEHTRAAGASNVTHINMGTGKEYIDKPRAIELVDELPPLFKASFNLLAYDKLIAIIAQERGISKEDLLNSLVKKEEVGGLLKSFAEEENAVDSDQHNEKKAVIKELVDNNYQFQSDNLSNPLKELTDFTIKYFEKYFAHFPDKAEELLRCNFPILYPYLKKVILKDPGIILFNEELNNQEAYDEFIFFIVDYFLVLFPEKEARDKELERHFNYCLGFIIIYIKEEELKRRIS